MAIDIRKRTAFKVAPFCERGKVTEANQQAARRDQLDSIFKLGKIEGGGKIGEGLRELASISDGIRKGTFVGDLLDTTLNAIDGGVSFVADTTGITEALSSVGDFNPGVVNKAVGQARVIYDKVKNGNLDISDISDVFQDFQNLEQLAKSIFSDKKPADNRQKFCAASPYAVDLIAQAPKFNFMFIMDIQFAAGYENLAEIGDTMAFVIKRSGRPNIQFEYEDINMYNFQTKVPKRTTYDPMTMTFYDDNKNAAHLFYSTYLKAMSPIANMKLGLASQNGEYETNSMNFDGAGSDNTIHTSTGPINTNRYAASLGALEGDTTSIIQRIRLYHVFDYGNLMNIYNFYNPRILSFSPSELTMMESGDGSEFEFQFAYDSMYVDTGWNVQVGGDNTDITQLTGKNGKATYPIIPVKLDTEDTSDNSQQSLAPTVQTSELISV